MGSDSIKCTPFEIVFHLESVIRCASLGIGAGSRPPRDVTFCCTLYILGPSLYGLEGGKVCGRRPGLHPSIHAELFAARILLLTLFAKSQPEQLLKIEKIKERREEKKM